MKEKPLLSAWKGLATSQMPVFIGYEQAERIIAAMRERIMSWNPEAVIAIARGGLVPGTMTACMLGLPLFIAGFERSAGKAFWIGPPAPVKRVLIVDDSCSTGTTLKAVRDWLASLDYDCATLTIVHDPEVTGFVPDFSYAQSDLFRLPWERGEATPAARKAREAGKPDRAAEAPFIGIDLDGVFLPDVPTEHYDRDLASALALRRELKPHPTLPIFDPAQTVVITARPERDRDQTEAWLTSWGHAGLRVKCRPQDVPNDRAAVARYKAETATQLGCTHFIESDPELAIRIAAEAPHLIVSWWSAADARAWIVGSAIHKEKGRPA